LLADGVVGQMMEKVVLPEPRSRRTPEQIAEQCPWAVTGDPTGRKRNVLTTLELESDKMEVNNHRLQATYRRIEENEVRYQEYFMEDAEVVFVAFGSIARICLKAIEDAREQGIKVGLIRPITLWPFPTKRITELASKAKGFMVVELNAGQMVQDVRLAVEGKAPVYHYGRMGGVIPNPQEVFDATVSHFPFLKK
ncbi:MAG: 3-methyl-2-oxobutanoate dehydrogenase subunit beta, partial [Paramuribaculum sp.]|nr:3-methyl-2-oxobutanoate dehydrogenase subunit beta [Paramuribaculum sp.]